MKKVFSAILITLVCLFAVGCSATAEVAFDAERPWANHKTEVCEYMVKQVSADGTLLGQGTYKTTLSTNPGENVSYTYRTELTFTRASDGGVDKITTESVFNRSLLCSTTRKETDFSGENKKNNYRFTASHDTNDTEKMVVNYEYGENFERTKTLSSRYVNYDNEYLFCFARAIDVKSTGDINVVNLYESLLAGSITNYSLYYHAEESALTDWTKTQLQAWGFDTENVLSCDKVSLRRMSAPYGTPIEIWFSKNAFDGGNAKVPVKILYEAPKAPSGETDYTVTYLLSSYSVED